GSSGSAEDRCPPQQRQPAARGAGRDRHAPGARDLRGRRQVQPRRDRRRARRRADVLSALAGPRRGQRPHAPDLRVREHAAAPSRARAAARASRRARRRRPRRARRVGGFAMSAAAEARPERLITDIASLRDRFPALSQDVHGKPLVYLDNAASSQCPDVVLDAMLEQQSRNHANVHRGVHALSERATEAYEGAREKIRAYLNASGVDEIVFTRGTTESINLVASSLGSSLLRPGDEVLITQMEHHSNIIPWQLVCERTGARLVPAPITDRGEIDLDAFARLVNERTRIVAVAHVSNALGTVNPLERIIDLAHRAGAYVLVDGAQAMAHMKVDVAALDCDFYAFSGHKMFAPTGIGVLYGKRR